MASNNTVKKNIYFCESDSLSFIPPSQKNSNSSDDFISDPNKPVPYTSKIINRYYSEYFVEDQRFVSSRPDVLVYCSVT